MQRSDRLTLLAIVLATFLGLMLSTTGGSTGAGASGTEVVADGGAGTGADREDAGGIRSLSLVDPGAVAELAADVVATTTTTTTTTAPPSTTAPPTTAPARSSSGGSTGASAGGSAPAPPATSPPPPPPPPPAEPTLSGSCAANFHSWMNTYRNQNGVAQFANDGGIAHIPGNWSMSMARNQSLAHNPNYAGQVRSARPQARVVGENVGFSSSGARHVFDQMVASGSHRAAMLNSGYTNAATGCAVDPQGKVWVTVDFWG